MSQFEQGAPAGRILLRRAVTPGPTAGVDRVLTAPGLAIVPPVDQGVHLAQQFAQAIGYTAGTAETAGHILRQKEAEDEAAYNHDVGNGALSAREQLPGINDQIVKGQIKPAANESAEDFAARIAAQYGEGMSPGFQEGVARVLRPAVSDSFYANAARLEKDSLQQTNTMLVAGAATSTTPQEIGDFIDTYMAENKAPFEEAAPIIAGSAALRAARAGDAEALDTAIKAGRLDQLDPLKAQQYKAILADVHAQRSRDADASDRTDFENFAANTSSPEALRRYLDGLKNADPGWKNAQRQRIDALDAATVRQTQGFYTDSLKRDIFLNRWETGKDGKPDPLATLQAIAGRMDLPPGNPLHLDPDVGRELMNDVNRKASAQFEESIAVRDAQAVRAGRPWEIGKTAYTDLLGNPKELSASDRLESAMKSEFARLAATTKDQAELFNAQLRTSAANAYTVPEWKSLIEAGAAAATESALAGGAKGDQPLPESTAQGFALYKQISQKAGHLVGAYADEKASALYETALTLQELDKTLAGDDRAALAMAQRVRSNPNRRDSEQLVASRMFAVANDFSGVPNAGEMLSSIERLARVYAGSGMDAQSAVDKARTKVKQTRQDVNGFSIPIDAAMPEDLKNRLGVVARDVAEWYVGINPEEGIDPGDLTLARHSRSGLWYLAQADGSPAPTGRDPSLLTFDTAGLMKRLAQIDKDKRTDALTKVLREQNAARLRVKDAKTRPEDFTVLGVHPVGMFGQ